MNFIARLTMERDAAKAELETLNLGLLAIETYLLSSKFEQDTTVQVRDVLHRMREVRSTAYDAAVMSENAAVLADRERANRPRINCENCGTFGRCEEHFSPNFGVTAMLCKRCQRQAASVNG